MLITEVAGNIARDPIEGSHIDLLEIEWYEANKPVQRKVSNDGTELKLKLLKEGQLLHEGDILYRDRQEAIVVHIKPCDAIVLKPKTMLEMGTICYEIGNKHLPLFIQDDLVLMPFEAPMYNWLEASGYMPSRAQHQLLNLLKSNVTPHKHTESLFTKIITIASKLSKDDE